MGRKMSSWCMHGATRKNSPTLELGCYAVPWILVAPFSSNVGRLTSGTSGTAEIRSIGVGLIGTGMGPHFFFGC